MRPFGLSTMSATALPLRGRRRERELMRQHFDGGVAGGASVNAVAARVRREAVSVEAADNDDPRQDAAVGAISATSLPRCRASAASARSSAYRTKRCIKPLMQRVGQHVLDRPGRGPVPMLGSSATVRGGETKVQVPICASRSDSVSRSPSVRSARATWRANQWRRESGRRRSSRSDRACHELGVACREIFRQSGIGASPREAPRRHGRKRARARRVMARHSSAISSVDHAQRMSPRDRPASRARFP